ncbi:MAG TPA: M1 family aminopeptidase, partial [Chitinophagaceae bacterium]|nr:M1 family aminopeptidase [Chitinophagaceae bacterium]
DKATDRRTRVDAAFNPAHKDYFEVIEQARATVQHMSYDFPKWPYPYPHETVFDGLDQMEYPMMVNDNPLEEKADEIELTDHEIFHTMFPFYMGINETKYGWMDEGWATIGEWLISPMIDSSIIDEYGVEPYEKNAGTEADVPIKTLTPQLNYTPAFFLNSYPKPAFGYLYVRDMLGDSLFTKALHYYIDQWHGKHPMPYDFFNCINMGCGRNLNWFWQRWFFNDGFPDLAISKVTHNGDNYTVAITSKGSKPLPVDLVVYYTDGTTQKIHRTISVWEKGNTTVALSFTANKLVQKLETGSTYVPDINKADNEYKMK